MTDANKFNALLEEFDVNGTVCVTRAGDIVFSAARGWAERENNLKYEKRTKTYIASVTKQFTAACAMLLYEEGKLDIDARLSNYLPEYLRADEMTIRQMMNMTSGIPHELMVIYESVMAHKAEIMEQTGMTGRDFEIYVNKRCAPELCTYRDFLALVNFKPLNFAPGEKYEYSDTNYMMLGEIVSRVSGKDIGEFMTERIFAPLGMANTVFGAEKSDAPSYDVINGVRENMGRAHFVTGEGAICATAEDLCVWLNAVLRGEILTAESWKQCFTMVHDSYGFGWGKSGDWYCHAGGDLGYSAMVYINFETQTAIAIALNESAGNFNESLKRLMDDGSDNGR